MRFKWRTCGQPDAPPGALPGRRASRPACASLRASQARPRTSLIVPWGRKVALRGRLTARSRQSVGGAEIEVLERAARKGAREVPAGRVQTASGRRRSSTRCRPAAVADRASSCIGSVDGAPRRVEAAQAQSARRRHAASHHCAASPCAIWGACSAVRSQPAASASCCRARHRASRGRPSPDVRTNRDGRFAGTYRLRVRRPGVVLRIRVVVPAERGYPYLELQEDGRSRFAFVEGALGAPRRPRRSRP